MSDIFINEVLSAIAKYSRITFDLISIRKLFHIMKDWLCNRKKKPHYEGLKACS